MSFALPSSPQQIAILYSVINLLSSIGILALDFSKAILTLFELLQKLAMLDIPDEVLNWMVYFVSGRSHCSSCGGEVSEFYWISSRSIIQGSAIGPVSYVINAAKVTIVTEGKQMHKYTQMTFALQFQHVTFRRGIHVK